MLIRRFAAAAAVAALAGAPVLATTGVAYAQEDNDCPPYPPGQCAPDGGVGGIGDERDDDDDRDDDDRDAGGTGGTGGTGQLPRTGSDSIVPLTAAGIGLVGAGAGMVVVARRRREPSRAGVA